MEKMWTGQEHYTYGVLIEQLISSDTADQSSDWSVSLKLCSNWLVNLLKDEFQLLVVTVARLTNLSLSWHIYNTVMKHSGHIAIQSIICIPNNHKFLFRKITRLGALHLAQLTPYHPPYIYLTNQLSISCQPINCQLLRLSLNKLQN